jgi:23S rRNA (cytosine1962-C5)-methyltransferase
VLRLGKPLRDAVIAGHPWVFDRALRPPDAPLAAGAIAELIDERGALALVFVDPTSPLRARVLDRDLDAALDDAWARGRAAAAAHARVADPLLADTNAVRAIHGENDFMPGLVIDVYDGTAVVVVDGDGAAAFWGPRLPAVLDGLRSGGMTIDRAWTREPLLGGPRVLAGDEPPSPIWMHEHGARFEVDVRAGQKTGFFLDQRANRKLVRELSAGAEVCNLCCYTGGFSVQAALGGARRVTSVDVSAPAIAAAGRNLAASGLEPGDHELVCADVFDFLERAHAAGRAWDVVIVDPPSFAPSEKARGRALSAYRRLNAMALRVVGPGGLLVSASCSSHITEADLLGVLASAAVETGRRLRVRGCFGAASDHPTLPAFPEGRYLKCIVADAA